MPSQRQLREQLVQSEKRRLWGYLLTAFQYPREGNQEDGARLLMLAVSGTKIDNMQLKQERSQLDVRGKKKKPNDFSLCGHSSSRTGCQKGD